jgi:polyisoprenoid-binding protein YceI
MARRFVVFVPVLALLVAGAAAAWTRTSAPASVTFKAVMRPGGAFEGKTAELTVKEHEKTVKIIVPLRNLETGISLRDKHMKEKYLEVDTYPVTTLEVQRAALKFPEDGKVVEGDATGTFTLHGVTKDVKFHYKGACDAAGVCDVTGSFDFRFSDHGVVVPSYLGVTVKPETSIVAMFQVKRDPPAAPPPAAPPPAAPPPAAPPPAVPPPAAPPAH